VRIAARKASDPLPGPERAVVGQDGMVALGVAVGVAGDVEDDNAAVADG
jgi:hypothetical protein